MDDAAARASAPEAYRVYVEDTARPQTTKSGEKSDEALKLVSLN